MRPYAYWLAAAVIAAARPAPAAPAAEDRSSAPAAEAPAAPAAEPAAQEALSAAEDVAILKALIPLQLTRSQLSDLLPALQSAQAKLSDLDAKEATKSAAWQSSLEQARRDLLAGKSSGARASDQFALAQWGAAQKRAALRADLTSSLQATLEKLLTPAQAAQVAAGGKAVLVSQRMAAWPGGGRGGWGGPGGPGRASGAGAPGTPGGGRGSPADRLDRIRQMSPAEFEQFAQRGARRFGGPDSPQFQQYTALMNQVRSMPQSQYLLQRDQLAAQSFGGRGGPGAAADTSAEAARAFIDRYLLSPRAPAVVRDRLQTGTNS